MWQGGTETNSCDVWSARLLARREDVTAFAVFPPAHLPTPFRSLTFVGDPVLCERVTTRAHVVSTSRASCNRPTGVLGVYAENEHQ